MLVTSLLIKKDWAMGKFYQILLCGAAPDGSDFQTSVSFVYRFVADGLFFEIYGCDVGLKGLLIIFYRKCKISFSLFDYVFISKSDIISIHVP
jgi:hypothetical protein